MRLCSRCSQWKINKYYIFWVCVCSVRYPACKFAWAVLPSVACLSLQYFSTLSHKRHDFRKKIIDHKICVLIFCTTFSETSLILWRTDFRKKLLIIKCVCWFSVQLSLKHLSFYGELIFGKKLLIINDFLYNLLWNISHSMENWFSEKNYWS